MVFDKCYLKNIPPLSNLGSNLFKIEKNDNASFVIGWGDSTLNVKSTVISLLTLDTGSRHYNKKLCTNPDLWLHEILSDYSLNFRKELINPSNCQSSCANKSRHCVACTNEDYYKCKVSGQCVHPALRCDGHRQCKYGEDEENCFEEYKNNARKEATYICKNFLNITTFARVCDSNW